MHNKSDVKMLLHTKIHMCFLAYKIVLIFVLNHGLNSRKIISFLFCSIMNIKAQVLDLEPFSENNCLWCKNKIFQLGGFIVFFNLIL